MSEHNNDVCIICQEHGTLQNYIVENKHCKCRYYYHETCFPPSRRKKCPMCAKEISHIIIEIPAPSAPPATPTPAPPATPTPAPPATIVNASAPRPNQIPLLSSQPPQLVSGQGTRFDKRKIPGCICASIIIIAVLIVLILVIGHSN